MLIVSYLPPLGRNRRTYAVTGLALAGLALTAVAAPVNATPSSARSGASATSQAAKSVLEPRPVFDDGRYVVLLRQAPTAAYEGGVSGFSATAPEDGAVFDANARAAKHYDGLLERRQDRV